MLRSYSSLGSLCSVFVINKSPTRNNKWCGWLILFPIHLNSWLRSVILPNKVYISYSSFDIYIWKMFFIKEPALLL